MISSNLSLLGQGIINWTALWNNQRRAQEGEGDRGRNREGGRDRRGSTCVYVWEGGRGKYWGGEIGVNVCVCVCVWPRESKREWGGERGRERVRDREVRFTHAPTIMPSWRVEYILYIIQGKNEHTHSQYARLVCLRKNIYKRWSKHWNNGSRIIKFCRSWQTSVVLSL